MKGLMKRFMKQFRHGEKGFTLVELLVVIAIIGVLAAVVVPNVGKFMGRGKTEAYATELHNVQTATMAMMADSASGTLTGSGGFSATDDMDTITAGATADAGTDLQLSDYITGLDADGKVTTGCTYAFGDAGTVTQTTPE